MSRVRSTPCWAAAKATAAAAESPVAAAQTRTVHAGRAGQRGDQRAERRAERRRRPATAPTSRAPSSWAREIGASSSQKPSAAEASTGPNSRLTASATATAAAKRGPGQHRPRGQAGHRVALGDRPLGLEDDVDEHRADHQRADQGDVGVVERLAEVLGGPAAPPVADQPLELAGRGRVPRRARARPSRRPRRCRGCSSARRPQLDDAGGDGLDQRGLVAGEDDGQALLPLGLEPLRPARRRPRCRGAARARRGSAACAAGRRRWPGPAVGAGPRTGCRAAGRTAGPAAPPRAPRRRGRRGRGCRARGRAGRGARRR